jgi:hypothetical protein
MTTCPFCGSSRCPQDVEERDKLITDANRLRELLRLCLPLLHQASQLSLEGFELLERVKAAL